MAPITRMPNSESTPTRRDFSRGVRRQSVLSTTLAPVRSTTLRRFFSLSSSSRPKRLQQMTPSAHPSEGAGEEQRVDAGAGSEPRDQWRRRGQGKEDDNDVGPKEVAGAAGQRHAPTSRKMTRKASATPMGMPGRGVEGNTDTARLQRRGPRRALTFAARPACCPWLRLEKKTKGEPD